MCEGAGDVETHSKGMEEKREGKSESLALVNCVKQEPCTTSMCECDIPAFYSTCRHQKVALRLRKRDLLQKNMHGC